MPAEIKHCTSCGSVDIVVAGNKFLCRACNIVYEVTDTGTKVLDAHPLDEINKRLDAIEANQKLKQYGKEPELEPAAEPEPEPAPEPDEDETEEDGFVTFE